jgi:KUP system potassium uptake protein
LHANQLGLRAAPVRTAALTLGAIGVVFGDIGTSPLYAMREAFLGGEGIEVTESNVLGIVSLIAWSLILVISVKYLTFVMRADNGGEGGILALLALLVPATPVQRRTVVVAIALFGAALLYGDGMITPAISVLSAVEGFEIATDAFEPYVKPTAVIILALLFAVQSRGTGVLGGVFGPVMLVWFGVIALLGVISIVDQPQVLRALSPSYAVNFLIENTTRGFLALGAVFLVVTGSEALFADMGHFGRRPIALGWGLVVLPALALNYAGQGAELLHDSSAITSPFYLMAPEWGRIPLAVLATAATIIASQALISGAFSLTAQAIQLDYAPRLRVVHTSIAERGQIYVPLVNWTLMLGCIGLVLGFGSSGRLAGAYGVGVTTAMVIDSVLIFLIARERWHWSTARAGALVAGFLVADLAFFGANLFKIPDGGWFPLVVGTLVFTLMATWRRGRELVGRRVRDSEVPIDTFLSSIAQDQPERVPGTLIFLHRRPLTAPPAMLATLRATHVLPADVILLSVQIEEVARVPELRRADVLDLGQGMTQIQLHFGFAEEPAVVRALSDHVTGFVPETATYVLGLERVVPTERPGMAPWREGIFAILHRNATPAAIQFGLPHDRVLEVGQEVEL